MSFLRACLSKNLFLRGIKIPFILFVNTREVGSFNYMNWDQILELHKNENVEIKLSTNEVFAEEKPNIKEKKIRKPASNFSTNIKRGSELVKYQPKYNFTFGNFLSYIIVSIITFIAIIIVLDTFKSPLSNIFPNLELVLYNLFETLRDVILFAKDLN